MTAATRRIPHLKIGILGTVTIAAYGCWHYAFSVLLDPIIEDTGWSEPSLASAFGASILIGGLASIAGGWLLDRRGSRFVFALAGTIALVTFLVASITTSQLVFAATTAVGGGMIAALAFYHVTQTVAVRISPRDTTRAIAVLTVWGAFSSAIYLPAAGVLVERVGWRTTLLILSMSAVVALLAAAVSIDTRTAEMPGARAVFTEVRGSMSHHAARMFLVSQAVMGMVMGVVLAYQVPAMTSAGLPLAAASFWAGFRGFCQLLGRLPLLPLVRRFGVVGSMRVAYGAIGVGTIVLAFAGAPWAAAIYAVVAGFGIGAVSPLIGMFSRDLFGAASLGTAMGVVSLVFQGVGALGPPLAGFLAVSTGSRAIPVLCAGVIAVASVGLLRAPDQN